MGRSNQLVFIKLQVIEGRRTYLDVAAVGEKGTPVGLLEAIWALWALWALWARREECYGRWLMEIVVVLVVASLGTACKLDLA